MLGFGKGEKRALGRLDNAPIGRYLDRDGNGSRDERASRGAVYVLSHSRHLKVPRRSATGA